MVELVGMHRSDDAHLIDDFGQMWKQLADELTTFSMTSELKLSGKDLRDAADERESFPFQK